MNTDILLRLALTLGIIGLGIFAYWCINQRLLLKAQNNALSLFSSLPNKPVIVYFTTPDCAPCKTIQRPALHKLSGLIVGY